MQEIYGIEHFTARDIAELWGTTLGSINAIIRNTSQPWLAEELRFPKPDLILEPHNTRFWKATRLGELNEWRNMHEKAAKNGRYIGDRREEGE